MEQVTQSNKFSENSSITQTEDLINDFNNTVERLDEFTEQLSTITPNIYPFHLSMCVKDLDSTRHFYCNILGLEERRATKTSIHLDFYGCQLTLHEIPCYNAGNTCREVDAEDVPIPHFGVAIPLAEYERIKESLIANNIDFFKNLEYALLIKVMNNT